MLRSESKDESCASQDHMDLGRGMTDGEAWATRFKADWEIWRNPMPSTVPSKCKHWKSEFRQKATESWEPGPCYLEPLLKVTW
jgi:hypothetical protein